MKSENFITFIILIFISIQSFAQSVGVRVGLNLSDQKIEQVSSNEKKFFVLNPGFHAGILAEVPFPGIFSLESGIFLTTHGTKYKQENIGLIEIITNLYYLEVPVSLKLNIDLGLVKIYGSTGPYIAMGIVGKEKWKGSYLGQEYEIKYEIEWGSDYPESDYKQLDYGLILGGGVEIMKFQIGASYGLGLANISPIEDDGYRINNRVIQISLAYKIGR